MRHISHIAIAVTLAAGLSGTAYAQAAADTAVGSTADLC